jgi:hypothetical protein
MPVTIVEHHKWPSCGRTGVLQTPIGESTLLTESMIQDVLGFAPKDFTPYNNLTDYEFRFLADGVECCVWDWVKAGSNGLTRRDGVFNTWGPDYVFQELFPDYYTALMRGDVSYWDAIKKD